MGLSAEMVMRAVLRLCGISCATDPETDGVEITEDLVQGLGQQKVKRESLLFSESGG